MTELKSAATHEHEAGAPLVEDCDNWCKLKFAGWQSQRLKGACRVVDVKFSDKAHTGLVYAEVIVEDAVGGKWMYPAPYMVTDLSPYCPTQEKDYHDWSLRLTMDAPWYVNRSRLNDIDVKVLYQLGLSIEEVWELFDKRKEK